LTAQEEGQEFAFWLERASMAGDLAERYVELDGRKELRNDLARQRRHFAA
jgi:hypothetical protein